MGPNGSGKSTLLQIALGLIQPDAGLVVGKKVSERCVAYLPQDYRNALFPWLRLSANLALYSPNEEVEGFLGWRPSSSTRKKFTEEAKSVNFQLDWTKFPYQLSGGEQQILVLLLALQRQPDLIVADEPFSAIDFHKRGLILQRFTEWLDERHPTLLLVSHDLEEAIFLTERLIVLSPHAGDVRADITVPAPLGPRTSEWRNSSAFRHFVTEVMQYFS